MTFSHWILWVKHGKSLCAKILFVCGFFAPIVSHSPPPVAWTQGTFWCDLSSMNLVTWLYTIKPHIWGACQFDWILLNLVRLQPSIKTVYSKHFFRRLKPLWSFVWTLTIHWFWCSRVSVSVQWNMKLKTS